MSSSGYVICRLIRHFIAYILLTGCYLPKSFLGILEITKANGCDTENLSNGTLFSDIHTQSKECILFVAFKHSIGWWYITSTLSWLSKSSLQLLYFVTTARRSQVLEKGDYSCAIQIVCTTRVKKRAFNAIHFKTLLGKYRILLWVSYDTFVKWSKEIFQPYDDFTSFFSINKNGVKGLSTHK